MNRKTPLNERYMVPAVEQASRILFCLAENASSHMSLTEVCTRLGIHKSRAFSILETLQKFGLIQRSVHVKGYALGPALVSLSRKVLDNSNALRLAEPILEELAEETKATATFGIISDNTVFVVAKHEGGGDIGVTIRIGHRFPLTYGSHGKAVAAFLPPEDLDRLLRDQDLFFHGSPGNLDRARLQSELRQCRLDGFALDLGEMKPGLNSVASPVLGVSGTPLGYIALIGLFSEEAARRFGPSVAQGGRSLSQQLGARVDRKPGVPE